MHESSVAYYSLVMNIYGKKRIYKLSGRKTSWNINLHTVHDDFRLIKCQPLTLTCSVDCVATWLISDGQLVVKIR